MSTSHSHSGMLAASCRRSTTSATTSSARWSSSARVSSTSVQSAATTFMAVPPEIVPTLTVVPLSRRPSCLDTKVGGRGDHDLTDGRCMVEDEAKVAVQQGCVKRACTGERDLLADGEQQLDVHRRPLASHVASKRQQHSYGCLVVGTQNAVVGVLPHAIHEYRLDGCLQRDGVEVRTQQQRESLLGGLDRATGRV